MEANHVSNMPVAVIGQVDVGALVLAELDSKVKRQVWEKFPPSLTISITLAAGITAHKDLQRGF